MRYGMTKNQEQTLKSRATARHDSPTILHAAASDPNTPFLFMPAIMNESNCPAEER